MWVTYLSSLLQCWLFLIVIMLSLIFSLFSDLQDPLPTDPLANPGSSSGNGIESTDLRGTILESGLIKLVYKLDVRDKGKGQKKTLV